jgi:hypothetical protein
MQFLATSHLAKGCFALFKHHLLHRTDHTSHLASPGDEKRGQIETVGRSVRTTVRYLQI